jgi:chromosome segregation ATPase
MNSTYKAQLSNQEKEYGGLIESLESKYQAMAAALKKAESRALKYKAERDETRAVLDELQVRINGVSQRARALPAVALTELCGVVQLPSQGEQISELESTVQRLRRERTELNSQLADGEVKAQRAVAQRDARDTEIAKQKEVIARQAQSINDLHAIVRSSWRCCFCV